MSSTSLIGLKLLSQKWLQVYIDKYRVAQKSSHYNESSLNRIKTRYLG